MKRSERPSSDFTACAVSRRAVLPLWICRYRAHLEASIVPLRSDGTVHSRRPSEKITGPSSRATSYVWEFRLKAYSCVCMCVCVCGGSSIVGHGSGLRRQSALSGRGVNSPKASKVGASRVDLGWGRAFTCCQGH